MSEKAKNRGNRLSSINFVLLWICLTVATTYAIAGLFNWLWGFGAIEQFITTEFWRFQLFIGLLMGGAVAVVQKQALRLAFGQPFNGWIRAHLIGAFLGVIPLIIQSSVEARGDTATIIAQILASLPVAWVLYPYTKWSWSIVVTTLLANILAFRLLGNFNSDLASLSLVALRTGLIALNLLWLLREKPSQEKAKVDEAESYERLEDTLEDHEEEGVVEAIDYEKEAGR